MQIHFLCQNMHIYESKSGSSRCGKHFYFDIEWIQMIDYEHVPFRCRRCHALGHLFRDFPLTQKPPPTSDPEASEAGGFIKVTNRWKAHKKHAPKPKVVQTSQPGPSTSNSFGVLANQPEMKTNPPEPETMRDDHSKKGKPTMSQADTQGKEASTSDKQKEILWNTQAMQLEIPNPNASLEEEPMEELDYSQFMEEEIETIDIGDLDLPGLEKACTTNNFDNIRAGQLKNLEEVLSRAQRQKSLGI